MTLKHLLDNRYIYVDPELDCYDEVIDCYAVVVEVTKTHVHLINSYLNSEFILIWSITEDEIDINPNDIYIRRILTFYDGEKRFYSKDYITYDKDDNSEYLQDFLLRLKDCWKYKSDIQFRRSIDISVICEDLSCIKEFF